MGSPKTARDTRGVFPLSRVRIDQNASKPVPGKRLSNHVEWRIFITSQNILGDLQTRGFAQRIVLGMVRADTPPSRAEYQKCLYSQTLPPLKRPQSQIFSIWRSPSRLHICNCRRHHHQIRTHASPARILHSTLRLVHVRSLTPTVLASRFAPL